MVMKYTRYLWLAIAAAGLALASNPAPAALMVYEGFNGYNNAVELKGQAVNANTIGLDKTTNWGDNNGSPWDLVPGLAFGSGNTQLEIYGDAVSRRNNASAVLSSELDIDSAHLNGQGQYVGTLYTSYLVQFDYGLSNASPNGNVHIALTSNLNDNNQRRFRSGARRGDNSNANNQAVGVGYTGGSFGNGSGHVNVDGETFMILGRFTRVGETISAGTPGVGTVWALTSDQFDHFKANDWAGIDLAAVGTASNQVKGKSEHTVTSTTINLLNNSLFLQIGSGSTSDAIITFDEWRMGASFDDVTPVVPEPSSIASVLLGLAGAGVIRARLKK